MISTIFFDIGNVLCTFDHQRIWQHLQPFSTLSSEELQANIHDSGLMNRHESGELPPHEFFCQVQRQGKLLPCLSYEHFTRLWAEIFCAQGPVFQLAKDLQKHYRVGLLSNIGEIHWTWLCEHFPFFSQVEEDLRVLSFECGCMKPAEAIYQQALKRAQEKAEHCVYIDDIPEYAARSRQLGINAICYHSYEQLLGELAASGVRRQDAESDKR
ncbi:hypothetical protein CSB45_10680 [candidate division KSB3 bacterium]|uniref:Haloacid dehalogenase n=1 Tax=candidate division KSB3 bacterium TaxID=2044937 RepID=A0A2G6E3Q0_9BACT|nr:MAG: hypothetical protein CSB45_10680 [candidate division KSB3 bacterium]PIE29127.1 MAG: hypothetical protein CSA57_09945 [candidate division KSB3 bacterium]